MRTSPVSGTSDCSCPSQPAMLELQTQRADCTWQRPTGQLQSVMAAEPYRRESSVTEASGTLKLSARRAPLSGSPAAFSCNRGERVRCFFFSHSDIIHRQMEEQQLHVHCFMNEAQTPAAVSSATDRWGRCRRLLLDFQTLKKFLKLNTLFLGIQRMSRCKQR